MRIVAILIATGVVLNVAGVVRYPGGPLEAIGSRSGPLWLRLGTGPIPSPTWTPTASLASGQHIFLAETWMKMEWPLDAVVERVEPSWIGTPPAVFAVLVRAADPNAAGASTISPNALFVGRGTGGVFAPPPVHVAPRSCCEPDDQIVVEIDGARWGVFHLAGLWIDYRAGPFTFHAFAPSADAFRLTMPAP